ncbi:hypothetical protein GFY24_14410 [Nocardia sp. SYP-A9097]|uniref:hypothetical protein n=1 Tax=Nocardia sp. SYP-A9097 TaxID=2663237 RepID=UPI00129A6036|nr:hypothetical protein [Nocardia sp. SYP-A9097]MRH88621.1 hypothetical protein [Nocardia sp. SYP-A9097]
MPELPLARTNAEARLYLSLQPCESCGESRCTFRSAVITVEGALASRYTGECPSCSARRVYEFRLPAEVLPPPAGSVRFGEASPSELLDPGTWLWYSDVCIRQVPSTTATLDDRALKAARHTLATAIAAIDEVLKFIPDTEDRVPLSALTSADGLALYDREPGRFTRPRLEAVRDYYTATLAGS